MQVEIFDKSLDRFIASLEKKTIAKVLRVIDLLEVFSHDLKLPHSRIIGANLFELRVRGQQEIRIFYTFHKNKIILLRGFIKKTQKIPRKEIKVALQKLKTLD